MQKTSITANDGYSIPVYSFGINDNNIKGIVIICHGFGENWAFHKDLAERLLIDGYASVIFDQRGHGEPPGNVKKWQGIIPSYQCFIDDVITVTEYVIQTSPNVPLILFGLSMGGNIAANTILRIPPEKVMLYSCLVLESPWFKLYNRLNAFSARLIKILSNIAPNFTVSGGLSSSALSDDVNYYDNNTPEKFYHNRMSMRMLAGVYDAGVYVIKNANKISLPTFLAYADKDYIVCNKAILRFAENAGDNVVVKEYDSKHVIQNEKKEQFCKDVITFMDSQTGQLPCCGRYSV